MSDNISSFDDETLGGQGVVSRGDMAMLKRAIRNDWPIDSNKRQIIADRMTSIVQNGETDRDCVAAAKVLVAADGVNVRREAIDSAETRGPSTQINIDNRKLTILRIPDNGRGPHLEQR